MEGIRLRAGIEVSLGTGEGEARKDGETGEGEKKISFYHEGEKGK